MGSLMWRWAGLWVGCLCVAGTLLLPASAKADAIASVPSRTLKPFEAKYKTNALGIEVTLTRSLQEAEGRYVFRNEASLFIVSLKEQSEFTVKDGRIVGDHFTYALTGLGNRRRAVQFLHEEQIIRSLKKKQWTEHPLEADILDRLSQQAQLRLDLLNSPEPPEALHFRVVDGAQVKAYTLFNEGIETLQTPVGDLRTVHYRRDHGDDENRDSHVWLALDHDYLMVRSEHTEKNSTVLITLESASIGGIPVQP
jgi:hypothetical protein